jgi:uncharacterized protein (TIGR02466 family)
MIEPSLAIGLFQTPLVVVDLPAMEAVNAELAALLLAEEQAVPSWHRANIGGWHSVPDLSQRPQPCFRVLVRAVVDQVTALVRALAAAEGITEVPAFRYGVTAWGMVLRDGHYVTVHDHGDVHWSVAYYVDAGDDAQEPSGRLSFVDPRRSGRSIPELQLFPPSFEIKPRTGALVIFPGWLQHFVHAYRGQRPRICISCNLTLEVARERT